MATGMRRARTSRWRWSWPPPSPFGRGLRRRRADHRGRGLDVGVAIRAPARLAAATGLGIVARVARSTAARGLHPGPARDRRRAVGAACKWYPSGRNARTDIAFSIRFEMANAGLQMTAERPWFGVGLGWFQPRSAQYSSMRENSHNKLTSRSWPSSASWA